MTQSLNGVFRATVESSIARDPDGLMRVKVRVPFIHPRQLPTENLPQAEVCQDVGHMRGKFFPFRSGDAVWVMFEGGQPDKPVIVGGQVNAVDQMPDTPTEVQVDQSDEVVVETDDAGNLFIMDGRMHKRRVIFRSGGAELMLTANGDRVVVNSISGSVEVNGATVSVNAGNATVDAARVDIMAHDNDLAGMDSGRITESANDEILRVTTPKVPAVSNLDAVHGTINDGGTVPNLRGVPSPPARPLQSNKHNLRSRIINIGVGPTGFMMNPLSSDAVLSPLVDYSPNLPEAAARSTSGNPAMPFPLLPTLEINIRAAASVNLAAPKVNLGGAALVDLASQGRMTITALADLSVMAAGLADVTVGGKASIMVGGAADVMVGGKVDVTAGGAVSVSAGGKVDLKAGGAVTATVAGRLEANVGGNASLVVGGALDATVAGVANVTAGGAINITAPDINLMGMVNIFGALTMYGPTVGMSGVMLDLHMHPFVDLAPAPTPSLTAPPLPG